MWELQRQSDEQDRAMKEANRAHGKSQQQQETEESRRVLQELQNQHQPRQQ
jgi:hypothetical protein